MLNLSMQPNPSSHTMVEDPLAISIEVEENFAAETSEWQPIEVFTPFVASINLVNTQLPIAPPHQLSSTP